MSYLRAKSRRELEDLIQYLQSQYAQAFQEDDLNGLLEYCGGLSIAYSAVGCNELADKWMDEYVKNLDKVSPDIRKRLQTIRDLLPNR
jgi:hypothetical protein